MTTILRSSFFGLDPVELQEDSCTTSNVINAWPDASGKFLTPSDRSCKRVEVIGFRRDVSFPFMAYANFFGQVYMYLFILFHTTEQQCTVVSYIPQFGVIQ